MPLDFSQINPSAVYTVGEVAELFRVDVSSVRHWIDLGDLTSLPRTAQRGRHRILGGAILALAGLTPTPPVETPQTRSKRAAADREAISRMK